MGSGSNGEFAFEQKDGDFVTSRPVVSYAAGSLLPAPDMHSNPCSSAEGLDPFFGSAWNPLVSMRQTNSSSNLYECPRLSTFSHGSYSNMVGSFGLSACNQVAGPVSPCNYPEKEELGSEKTAVHLTDGAGDAMRGSKEADHGGTSEEESPNLGDGKKRKKMADASNFQSVLTEKLNDISHNTSDCSQEKDEINQKTEQCPSRKLSGKQAKDRSQTADAPKDDYIHVRAKRGQATNSHSLAERVRREKISERMKFLQDLVPGCNKVIGKAVMLDEIINYVQSLQRQVEFLSMKLAAVNPDLNFDIQRILSKEILNSREGGSVVLRYGPGLSASHSQLFVSPQGSVQEEIVNRSTNNSVDPLHATNAQFSTLMQIQGAWDDELQGVMQQMGFATSCFPPQT